MKPSPYTLEGTITDFNRVVVQLLLGANDKNLDRIWRTKWSKMYFVFDVKKFIKRQSKRLDAYDRKTTKS